MTEPTATESDFAQARARADVTRALLIQQGREHNADVLDNWDSGPEIDDYDVWLADDDADLLTELDNYDPLLDPSMLMGAIGPHADALLGAGTGQAVPGHREASVFTASPLVPREGEWREPQPCRCWKWEQVRGRWTQVPNPHSSRGDACLRCQIEWFATGRRSHHQKVSARGKVYDTWQWDTEGEYGATYQSSEIDGLRLHACRFRPWGNQRAQWIVVLTEFEALHHYVFQKNGVDTPSIRTWRTVVGYTKCFDQEEAEHLAREYAETLALQREALTMGFSGDLGPISDVGSMDAGKQVGTAYVSPEYLERFADAGHGRTTGRRPTGE